MTSSPRGPSWIARITRLDHRRLVQVAAREHGVVQDTVVADDHVLYNRIAWVDVRGEIIGQTRGLD